MKFLAPFLLLLPIYCLSQPADTVNGFENKVKGEEINYFSPLHQFAKTALLTRMNGEMPISWESPVYAGKKETVVYEFLLGHSTGTSTADRHFDVWLNDQKIFTITTPMKKTGKFELFGRGDNITGYHFISEEYDANADAFGKLFITVPASLVNKKAVFTINGQNENSSDWLMIFMYKLGLKILVQPTNLVTIKENKRQLNVFVDNPYPENTVLKMKTAGGVFQTALHKGYNSLNYPIYATNFSGTDSIQFVVNNEAVYKTISLKPVKNYVFHIIHHSHNDIGYSHLQTEVEQIQNRNIRSAIRWINTNKSSKEKPVWHIESLWAVENFLRVASPTEEKQFVAAVKSGQLVLSANYANILTGICQPEELNWMVEYAKWLEKKYGFKISNAMITDIPGISRSGLMAYVNNNISYLSLGPNYVQSLPDQGDRVGGVIREQGDKMFYWKPDLKSNKKLLVWTGGKGYSFFHGIAESEKQQAWEKRISDYCNELTEKNYPYDVVQLRYTNKSDNGPVDTMMTTFIENWNKKYLTPKLRISSVDKLFSEFEKKYGKTIPVATGEISPYWEDGAYSTAVEEMQARQLAIETIAMEKFATSKGQLANLKNEFYRLHRNIVMWDEHTWGSWNSISDPENPFTTEQWRIKKQFLDSAQWYYDQLAAKLQYRYNESKSNPGKNIPISDFSVDAVHGGLQTIMVNGKNLVSTKPGYKFFEPVYALGVNPMKFFQPDKLTISLSDDSPEKKVVEVKGSLPSIPEYKVVYTLLKNQGRLIAHVKFSRQIEKNKESLHIALPFALDNPILEYGSDNNRLRYGRDQLPGSNKEFVCVENELSLQSAGLIASLRSPQFSLYEVGDIIDENRINGGKVWKDNNQDTSTLFLYLLNNYWHTNYKAYQDGEFDFEIELSFRAKK